MVNTCSVTSCRTGYKGGEKNPSLYFPEQPELRKKWKVVNRKNWTPTEHSIICITHFEEKYVKLGMKCNGSFNPYQQSTLIWLVTHHLLYHKYQKGFPMNRNTVSDEWDEFKSKWWNYRFYLHKSDICPNMFTFLTQEYVVIVYRHVVD